MEADFVDISTNVVKTLKKNTKMIWIESPSNPTLKVIDIEAICKEVKAIDS